MYSMIYITFSPTGSIICDAALLWDILFTRETLFITKFGHFVSSSLWIYKIQLPLFIMQCLELSNKRQRVGMVLWLRYLSYTLSPRRELYAIQVDVYRGLSLTYLAAQLVAHCCQGFSTVLSIDPFLALNSISFCLLH